MAKEKETPKKAPGKRKIRREIVKKEEKRKKPTQSTGPRKK